MFLIPWQVDRWRTVWVVRILYRVFYLLHILCCRRQHDEFAYLNTWNGSAILDHVCALTRYNQALARLEPIVDAIQLYRIRPHTDFFCNG